MDWTHSIHFIPIKMKANFIVDYLQDHGFDFERNIGENEVWRNCKQIMVIHPTEGLKLIYRMDLFNDHYTEAVIEGDIEIFDLNKLKKKSQL